MTAFDIFSLTSRWAKMLSNIVNYQNTENIFTLFKRASTENFKKVVEGNLSVCKILCNVSQGKLVREACQSLTRAKNFNCQQKRIYALHKNKRNCLKSWRKNTCLCATSLRLCLRNNCETTLSLLASGLIVISTVHSGCLVRRWPRMHEMPPVHRTLS